MGTDYSEELWSSKRHWPVVCSFQNCISSFYWKRIQRTRNLCCRLFLSYKSGRSICSVGRHGTQIQC